MTRFVTSLTILFAISSVSRGSNAFSSPTGASLTLSSTSGTSTRKYHNHHGKHSKDVSGVSSSSSSSSALSSSASSSSILESPRLVRPIYINGTSFEPSSTTSANTNKHVANMPNGRTAAAAAAASASASITATPNRPKYRPSPVEFLSTLRSKIFDQSPTVAKLREHSFVLLAGLLLSFNAGYVNGCCLSGMLQGGQGVGVSAVTGAYTQAGLALGSGNFMKCISNLQIILCFMGGSALSGIIQPHPVPNRVSQGYGPTFLLGSVLLGVSATLANTRPEGRAFLYFAALANGLQNAMSSMYTANLIRSTHMSGISSDMGLFLGQMIRGNFTNTWRFIVLASLSSFFLLGGAISYHAVMRFKSIALIFNACLFAAVGLGCIEYTSYTKKVSLWTAATGNWTWKVNDMPSKSTLRKLFESHDKNRKGYLNIDEFSALLSEAGINMSDFGLRQVFHSTSENGRMSLDEIMALIYCDDDGECEFV
jgi:uncharacterized membrane protein YoaK (UPF0700 family)